MGSRNNLLETLFGAWTGIADTDLTINRPAGDVFSVLERKITKATKKSVVPGTHSSSEGWSMLEKDEKGSSLKAQNGDLLFFMSVRMKSDNESTLHIRAVPAEGRMFSNFIATLGNPDVQTDRLVSYLLEGIEGK